MERISSIEGGQAGLKSSQRLESGHPGMVSSRINAMVAAMAIGAAATLSAGCADDRPVWVDEGGETSTGTGGTGGTTSTETGGTGGTGGTTSTETGGTGGTVLPGADRTNVWQVFSYDIEENDAYDTMAYYRDKGEDLIDCAESKDCMEKALNDSPGRPFQFLKEGDYSESYPGWLKGYGIYRNGSCGETVSVEAGNNCKDSDGDSRPCFVAGVLQLSKAADGSPSGELPASHSVHIGFESGDECKPVVFSFGSEHGVTFLD